MLETVRKRLRALVKLIDKQARKPIYTDFEDLMGAKRRSSYRGSPRQTASNDFEPRPGLS